MNHTPALVSFLNKPFPKNEGYSNYIKTVSAISVFIALFLYIFQPSGLADLKSSKFLICIGFGLVTFFTCILYELITNRLMGLWKTADNFTFWKWIIQTVGLIFTISLANFFFTQFVIFSYMDWSSFPPMLYATFAVGVFPTVALGTIALLKQEKKFQNIAEEINTAPSIQPEKRESTINKIEVLGIPVSSIRYVEALQNYVRIGYLTKAGYEEKTERATLKSIVNQESQNGVLVRCHRSFLVNRDVILSASGNAQGLKLTLADCDVKVPVSRKYVPIFRI